jgi:hypothetical protein
MPDTRGVPEVDDCGGDRQTWNSKVKAETRVTRFIQVRAARVADPTSCLGDQLVEPRRVVVDAEPPSLRASEAC